MIVRRLYSNLPPFLRSKPKPELELHLKFSNSYTYAQVWRTADNQVVASASTIEKPLKDSLPENVERTGKPACEYIGGVLAERLKAAGVTSVHWARQHGEKYHGRNKALLDALKANGIELR